MRNIWVWMLLAFFVGCQVTPLGPGDESDAGSGENGVQEVPQIRDIRDENAALDASLEPSLRDLSEGTQDTDATGEQVQEAEPPPDTASEAVTDAFVERPPEQAPALCPTTSACNTRLTSAGACPGMCIPQKRGIHCPGTVAHGLCHDAKLPAGPSGPFQYPNGLKMLIEPLPDQAKVGQIVTINAVLSNPTNNPITVMLHALPRLPAWTIQQTSFTNPGPITVAGGSQIRLSTTMLPNQATIFDHEDWVALLLMIDNSQAGIRMPVGFPPNSGITCGSHSFPKTWCKRTNCQGDAAHYNHGRCCAQVFYPGADCCADADCVTGACYDGLCVGTTPNNTLALTPLVGQQHILVVAADSGFTPPPGGVCTKAGPALEQKLNLDKVATWLTSRVTARLGKPMLQIHWHTFVVSDSQIFAPGADKMEPNAMLGKLETWLKQQGCIKGFDEDFDRVLLITPRVQIPSTGRAVALNRVVALSYSPHSLLAHELGHVYGGRDLYLTSGGKLQWRSALMSVAEIPVGQPRDSWSDAVLWGEAGLGDTDKDGVIDIAQWPVDPIALLPGTIKVLAFQAGSNPELKLDVPLQAKEPDGALLPVRLPTLRVTLPDYPLSVAQIFGREAAFRGTTFDPAPIVKAGQVKVRLEATWHLTRSDGSRHTLILDHSVTLTIP